MLPCLTIYKHDIQCHGMVIIGGFNCVHELRYIRCVLGSTDRYDSGPALIRLHHISISTFYLMKCGCFIREYLIYSFYCCGFLPWLCLYKRYHLKGPKAGQWDMFISSLPGTVDNITPSKKVPGFWIAIPSVRPTALLDFSFQWSLLHRIQVKVCK